MLKKQKSLGFTLIELMIVISVIAILLSIAIPSYQRSVVHARESVLKQNLFQMRSLISQYTLDKQKAPQSLDDLVTAGYLRQIPVDPITGRNDTWKTDEEDYALSVDATDTGGIKDVHSGSDAVSSDGTPYSSW